MIRSKIINLAVIFLFVNCGATLYSKKEIHGNTQMLYGEISIQQLYFDYPEWQNIELQYKPDISVTDQLRKIDGNYKVQIFLATWCSDSKNEVPKFFKILKIPNINTIMDVKLFAVDRGKHLDNNLPQENNIEFVPTFIFYKNNREIGRIVETPDISIEQDILDILTREFNDHK